MQELTWVNPTERNIWLSSYLSCRGLRGRCSPVSNYVVKHHPFSVFWTELWNWTKKVLWLKIDQLNFLQCKVMKIHKICAAYLCILKACCMTFPDWKAHRIQNQPVFILFQLIPEPEAFLGKLSCILQRRKFESHKITAKSHNLCPAFNTRSILTSSYITKRFNDFFSSI